MKFKCFAIIAASLLASALVFAQAPSTQKQPSVASTKKCLAGEDAFKALKLSKAVGAIRVDYLNLQTNKKSWTNMGAQNLSALGVKVGATFCLTHDTEGED